MIAAHYVLLHASLAEDAADDLSIACTWRFLLVYSVRKTDRTLSETQILANSAYWAPLLRLTARSWVRYMWRFRVWPICVCDHVCTQGVNQGHRKEEKGAGITSHLLRLPSPSNVLCCSDISLVF